MLWSPSPLSLRLHPYYMLDNLPSERIKPLWSSKDTHTHSLFSGFLFPLSVFSFLWLSLLEEESQFRTPLCGILVASRYIIFYVFTEVLFLSHVFRSFLVVFSERGLVSKGKTNLKLFHQLFWVLFCAFLVVFTFIMPISHVIRGKFPETTKKVIFAC